MPRHKVRIVFCTPCGFFREASDLGEEIEKAFPETEVELEDGERGVFDVYVEDKLVFSRYKEMRMPEAQEILEHLR